MTIAATPPVTATPSTSVVGRLFRTELRLMAREPMTLTWVFAFPVVTMLIIGNSFGRSPDDAFPVDPAHWYVASYFTIVIAATGLVMVPVHIAAYRERGVLRRFAASGFPRWSFAIAQLAVALTTIAASCTALLLVAMPVYGVPRVHDLARVALAVVAGSILFVSIGVLLGSVLTSARAAQAVGMLVFFPSFLLGGGGPPPAVMGSALEHAANVLPLTVVTKAVRGPWLGVGADTGSLVITVVLAAVALVLAVRRTAL